MNELSSQQLSADIIASLVLTGDVSKLNPTQKVQYYNTLCERIGLDPTTQPFKLLKLQGREVLYADKGATQQLSQIYKLSHQVMEKKKIDDVYVVTVRASNCDGRFTEEDGAVSIAGLKGNELANALMKAQTKAKRRAVLAFCGLGMLDESEIETIPNVKMADFIPSKPEVSMPKAKDEKEAIVEPGANPQGKQGLKSEDSQSQKPFRTITEAEGKDLMNLAKVSGYTKEDVKDYAVSLGYARASELNESDLVDAIEYFKMPKEQREKELKELWGVDGPSAKKKRDLLNVGKNMKSTMKKQP